MKPKLCLLLPLLGSEDVAQFDDLPADALLASGNLPALSKAFEPIFCVLAPGVFVTALEQSARLMAVRKYAELRVIRIDDLSLDFPFEVLPSLAYLKGIADQGDALVETAFIFLEPNLVLANGALRNLGQRLADGTRVVLGTLLRVNRSALLNELGALRGEDGLAPRDLVRHAIDYLDFHDLANVVNSGLPVAGPAGRLIWKHDRSTLLVYDFTPALVALRPSRKPDQACGFRDVAFASVMCPDAKVQHLTDSDEFVGIELIDSDSGDGISARRDVATLARELSRRTDRRQRAGTAQFPAIFRAGEVPADLSRTRAAASAHIDRLIRAMPERSDARLQERFWKLGLYLWAVRRFELGRGPLPDPPALDPFHQSEAAISSGGAMTPPHLHFLTRMVRALRDRFIGRAPMVTFMHPEWLEYRALKPALRAAVRAKRERVLYVSASTVVLGRVLGAPDFTAAQLLDGSFDPDTLGTGPLDLIVMELSADTIRSWAELVNRLLAGVKPGGRIVVFYYNSLAKLGTISNKTLAQRCSYLNHSRLRGLSMFVTPTSDYRGWLWSGFPIVQHYARRRKFGSLLKGAILFAIIETLTLLQNVSGLRGVKDEAARDASLSATIVIDV
jgi:hypothetical protein